MTEHDRKMTAKRSEQVENTTTPPPTPSRRRRRPNNPTTPNAILTAPERVEPPVYKSSNKKKGQNKGEVI
jgi:hypothetical protein